MNRRIQHGLIFLALSATLLYFGVSTEPPPSAPNRDGVVEPRGGDELVTTAFRERRSDVAVEVGGKVSKLLPDDTQGSRHQRFILRLASGHTVLVAHNIDLAPRIDDLATGDEVTLHGEYEWNERGGVIHWTHHDPAGRHAGGWIRHKGQTYQ